MKQLIQALILTVDMMASLHIPNAMITTYINLHLSSFSPPQYLYSPREHLSECLHYLRSSLVPHRTHHPVQRFHRSLGCSLLRKSRSQTSGQIAWLLFLDQYLWYAMRRQWRWPICRENTESFEAMNSCYVLSLVPFYPFDRDLYYFLSTRSPIPINGGSNIRATTDDMLVNGQTSEERRTTAPFSSSLRHPPLHLLSLLF